MCYARWHNFSVMQKNRNEDNQVAKDNYNNWLAILSITKPQDQNKCSMVYYSLEYQYELSGMAFLLYVINLGLKAETPRLAGHHHVYSIQVIATNYAC